MGGVRTALFNYLFARRHGGTFILRIEDTDQSRYVPGAENYIIDSLEWCGLQFDEGIEQGGPYGPYRQSERREYYRQYADQLINSGDAYFAFDTPEELNEARGKAEAEGKAFSYDAGTRGSMKNSLSLPAQEVARLLGSGKPYVIRFKMPETDEAVEEDDLIRGKVTFHTAELDDKVLFKSDGMPTYHLANVVDDHLMHISHVIRGEEWLPSMPLHVMLYLAFGWDKPRFAHLPLILKPQGKGKLSKRDGDKMGFPVFPLQWKDQVSNETFSGYREDGYFPESFINILALLGWNPGTEQELFGMEELVQAFGFERVNKSGARFDPEKAKWFNHQYLIQKSDEELAGLFMPILQSKGLTDLDLTRVVRIIGMVKERVSFVKELWEQTHFFFQVPENYDPKVVKKRWKGEIPAFMPKASDLLQTYDGPWEAEAIKTEVSNLIEKEAQNFGGVMNSLRLALVGGSFGPDLFAIVEILGKEEVVARLNKALKEIVG
jgi:glutamyl-tRNA synthetase